MKKNYGMGWACGMAMLATTAMAADTVATLGIRALPLDPVLAGHLSLPEGLGLVVHAVPAESPAKDILKPFDILQKLDDQILVSPQQLHVLVTTHKPGDEIKLAIIRHGKPETVSVKLGEAEKGPPPFDVFFNTATGITSLPLPALPPMGGGMVTIAAPNAEELLRQQEAIRAQIGLPQGPQVPPQAGNIAVRPAPVRAAAQAKSPVKIQRIHAQPQNLAGQKNVQIVSSVTSGMTDVRDGVSIEAKQDNDQQTVRIEKDGKTLYEGALNTPDDVEKAPKEFRDRVQAMFENMKNMSIITNTGI